MAVNTAEFCKQFNARTEADGWKPGIQVPVRLFTYSDRTYKFEIRYPKVYTLLKMRKNDTILSDNSKFLHGPYMPGHAKAPVGYIDVREIYEIAKFKMQEQGKEGDYLQAMAQRIAINCERNNVKVVQFGGKRPKPKLNRMFEPYYNVWTLYDENIGFWHKKSHDHMERKYHRKYKPNDRNLSGKDFKWKNKM